MVPRKKPDNYRPPDWRKVRELAQHIRYERMAYFEKVAEIKKALRGDWDDILRKIPQAYRSVQPNPDVPELRDMLRRIVGRIARDPVEFQVISPSGRVDDIRKASAEESRIRAIRPAIEAQQEMPLYTLGVDSQCAWGESWISCWPNPSAVKSPKFKRAGDEDAKAYLERVSRTMATNIPIRMHIHDPQTVLPFMTDEGLAFAIIETEHSVASVNLGLGYVPVTDRDGKVIEWLRDTTLGYGTVGIESLPPYNDGLPLDRDTRSANASWSGSSRHGNRRVTSHVYVDPWTYQRYLDGVLVEQWEHDFGFVPLFPAWAIVSSEADPRFRSVGIIDSALVVAKQIVFFAAVLAANAMQHGWPTPFVKNAQFGVTTNFGTQPTTRPIKLGEVNLLAPGEEIVFPFLQAQMMPDFLRYIELLTQTFEGTTLGSFRGNVSSDTSGYAVAQVRAMQETILSPIYNETKRQWKQIAYFWRHMVKNLFKAGIYLPGAVEVVEVDGEEREYRPILEYGPKDCTDFIIETEISAQILQDEIAERKSALEMLQLGVWSPRRVMEVTGVDDPVRESEEIATWRLLNSPAADQVVLQMAMAIAAERYQATQQQASSPFYQALNEARNKVLQQAQAGQPSPQGGMPQNALPGGQPMQQNPPMPPPQQGGPMQGPTPGTGMSLNDLGVPQLPGGVPGGQTPAVMP
ncbi:MAG: hypothetical protein KatS3mg015_2883 [Fimbriimonadales bacterium]|nr:MAG: hypothetical protein KatS3mg015_2883 [Fimbriimonadales bacterium]